MGTSIKMAAVLLAVSVFSATALSAASRGGVDAGYLNSRYSVKSNATGSKMSDYFLNGFYVGLSDEVRLFAGLHIQPGLYYSYLTDKSRPDVLSFRLNGDITEHSLNLPIMLKYKFGLPGVKLYVFGGPTLYLGLVSRQKYTVVGEYGGHLVNGDISYNMYTGKARYDGVDIMADDANPFSQVLPDWRYSRFDVQMGAGVGIEFLRFLEVKAGYDWGLLDRHRGSGAEIRRDQVYIAVGFRF